MADDATGDSEVTNGATGAFQLSSGATGDSQIINSTATGASGVINSATRTSVVTNGDCYDFNLILSSPGRDFLIRNNGEKVQIDTLKGKKLGLYFADYWWDIRANFTPVLVRVYNELSSKGIFEIVFVSVDEDEETFNKNLSRMPWLAIPYADLNARRRVYDFCRVPAPPEVVILNEDGKVLSHALHIIWDYEAEGYPFTEERKKELEEEEEWARKNQSISTLLVSRSRDFVITPDGNKVNVSALEGKTVGLYFSDSNFHSCAQFTPKLLDVYKQLKEKGENFEIVWIPMDDEEESFKKAFANMPWFALPHLDQTIQKLIWYFEAGLIPHLPIIGPNGKTLCSDVVETIEDHGVEAYPFTPEKFVELAEIERAREEAQTLESLLVAGEHDYVINKDGAKIAVSELVGKNILLYFSARWCNPRFGPKLMKAYNKIKARGEAFEVIYISHDLNQSSFDEFFSDMPWLALPFGDARNAPLRRKMKVQTIPMLVALGPSGRTINKEVKELIAMHGSLAYPFTGERVTEVEDAYKELESEGCILKVLRHHLHPLHFFRLTRQGIYTCGECHEVGRGWSFNCIWCDHFNLHPNCGLMEDERDH